MRKNEKKRQTAVWLHLKLQIKNYNILDIL